MKIYIDVTNLLAINFLTGIQRVVREVTIRLLKDNSLSVVPFSWEINDKKLSLINTEDFLECFDSGKLQKEKISVTQQIDIESISHQDIFFDLDAVWNQNVHSRAEVYPILKRLGTKIITYIHDIIPITHPQYCHENTLLNFMSRYLTAVLNYSDMVITSTNAVLKQVNELCTNLGLPQKAGRVSWLGADFKVTALKKEKVSDIAKHIVDKGKYILVVGTIEPRKNHKLLLDSYDKKLSELGVNLVFAGRRGWNIDEFMNRVERHPKYGNGLYNLEGQNDETIKYLYENAFVVAFPTFDEGFGLPMVEALQHGSVVVASDIEVLREVGGEYSKYFNPNSPDEFIKLIETYLADSELYEKQRNLAKKYVPITWNEVSEKISGFVSELKNEKKLPIPDVKQLVILSARISDLLDTLPFIERFMLFIKEVVVCCPDKMAEELPKLYKGRLSLVIISDSEALAGNKLPEDHQTRNFFLRSQLLRSPKIDDVFIMCDDDNRPIKEVGIDTFIKDDMYIAYYCYDLDKWKGAAWGETSFDKGKYKSLDFLKKNNFSHRMFASHQPQIIDKRIWNELHDKYPQIEGEALCEWETYFNYAITTYPAMFKTEIYKTIAWPSAPTDWEMIYQPKEYLFENYYPHLYEDNQIFSGFSKELTENQTKENLKKCNLFDEELEKYSLWQKHFEIFRTLYRNQYAEYASISLYNDGEKIRICLPHFLILEQGSFVRIPVATKFGNKFKEDTQFSLQQCIYDSNGNTILDSREFCIEGTQSSFKFPVYAGKAGKNYKYELFCKIGKEVFVKTIPFIVINTISEKKNENEVYMDYKKNAIDIEKIMEEIRSEIETKGCRQSDISFSDFKQTNGIYTGKLNLCELDESLKTLTMNWQTNIFSQLSGKGVKLFIKRAIRKFVRSVFRPFFSQQEIFNKSVAQTLNQMNLYIRDINERISKIEQEQESN